MQTITGFDEKLATIFVKLFTGSGDPAKQPVERKVLAAVAGS